VKQQDLAILIVAVVVSAVIGAVVANFIFGGAANKQYQVKQVPSISSNFDTPGDNSPYFNNDSIDPTQLIRTGQNNNKQPFQQ
jgi:nitrogen fixation-related uncharacterized protein